MEEPNYITVGQLKKRLGDYPDHMPVVGTVILEDSAGCHTYGIVRIC